MKQILTTKPTGIINRRDKADEGDPSHVLARENFMVIGIGDDKLLKKIPGSDRLSVNDVGNSYVSGYRYYSVGGFRKTFAFNHGSLYFIDDSGNETSLLSVFDPTAVPCWEQMRVSEADILCFSEGKDTGMYSYDGNVANQFNKEASVNLNFVGMLNFLDRMWGFEEDSDIIYFSVNLNPFDYTNSTDAGQISIGAKRGSKIQAIRILNETLYIFKNDSIWAIIGKTPSEFTVVEVHPYIGVAARHSVSHTETSIIFFASDFEFYVFGGTLSTTQLISYQIAMGGDYTKDLLPIINRDRLDQVRSVFHNHIYRCSFVEDGKTKNNLEWCFNTTNKIDFITRDNNVSCYILWDRLPDQQQLITGRSDVGRLMFQYRGLNWDNQAANPTMPINILTKFSGLKEPRNFRAQKAWLNAIVLGAYPIDINYYLDTRIASSTKTTNTFTIQGEQISPTSMLRLQNQRSITSRQVLTHDGANGQSIAFEINQSIANTDFSFSSIQCLIITKELKRNEKISI